MLHVRCVFTFADPLQRGKLIPFWKDGGHDAMDGLVTGFRLPDKFIVWYKSQTNLQQFTRGIWDWCVNGLMDDQAFLMQLRMSSSKHHQLLYVGSMTRIAQLFYLSCNMIAGRVVHIAGAITNPPIQPLQLYLHRRAKWRGGRCRARCTRPQRGWKTQFGYLLISKQM